MCWWNFISKIEKKTRKKPSMLTLVSKYHILVYYVLMYFILWCTYAAKLFDIKLKIRKSASKSALALLKAYLKASDKNGLLQSTSILKIISCVVLIEAYVLSWFPN